MSKAGGRDSEGGDGFDASALNAMNATAAKDAQKGDGKEKDPDDDWWEDFRRAVEDPNINIYDYLRAHALRAMDLDNNAGLSEGLVLARQKALQELFALTDPEELAKKLKLLEKNALLFNAQARAVMKVSRAVLETFVKTKKEGASPEKEAQDLGAAIGASLKEELATMEKVEPGLEKVAAVMKDKDEQVVADTIRKAAKQMSEDRNVLQMVKDMATFTRRYLKPDNVVNIAIIALPLVTWQYRWALALGLGAFAARHSVYHGYKAGKALYQGDKGGARTEGQQAIESLKAAGGSVLLIALTPALAKLPVVAAGFAGFAADALYNMVLDNFKKMLAEEEKKPGTTPVGRRVRAGVKTFFQTYEDSLARLSARALKAAAPGTVTVAIEEVSKRMPLTKLRKMVARGWMISGALTTRFNRVAQNKATEVAQEMGALRNDIVTLGRDFVKAADGFISEMIQVATQRERERMLAELRAQEQERLAQEEAEARAAEEARLRAEDEARWAAEGGANCAESAEDAGAHSAEFNAQAQAEGAQESAKEAARVAAEKKRKLESMERHRKAENTQRNRLTARPD